MKKHIFLFLALAALAGGGAFAQTHFISAEASYLGGGGRYEYVISRYFTVGGNIYFNFIPTPFLSDFFTKDHTNFGMDIAGRWYPAGRRFFMELGLGYSTFTSHRDKQYVRGSGSGRVQWTEEVTDTFSGFGITPGFGWTIDTGRAGGFFISPGIKVPLTLTSESSITDVLNTKGEQMKLGGVLVTPVVYFGLGYAF